MTSWPLLISKVLVAHRVGLLLIGLLLFLHPGFHIVYEEFALLKLVLSISHLYKNDCKNSDVSELITEVCIHTSSSVFKHSMCCCFS